MAVICRRRKPSQTQATVKLASNFRKSTETSRIYTLLWISLILFLAVSVLNTHLVSALYDLGADIDGGESNAVLRAGADEGVLRTARAPKPKLIRFGRSGQKPQKFIRFGRSSWNAIADPERYGEFVGIIEAAPEVEYLPSNSRPYLTAPKRAQKFIRFG